MCLQCKIIISARLWRVGYRQVVLGCRKHFGCPKTQLANFVNFVDFSLACFVYMQASTHSLTRKIIIFVDFSLARFVYMQASTHSLTRKIIIFVDFSLARFLYMQASTHSLTRKIIIFVDFSLARFLYMQASTHSLTRKIRLNINFQCLEIITHSLLFSCQCHLQNDYKSL